MCGIRAVITRNEKRASSVEISRFVANRGPDHQGVEVAVVTSQIAPSSFVSLSSSVLALRGDHVTPQPFVDSNTGSLLCWNGEAWTIDDQPVSGNDGQTIFELLLAASAALSHVSDATASHLSVLEAMRRVAGPYAFVYYDKLSELIYFARDPLGRRSLLYMVDHDSQTVELSSVADHSIVGSWFEVEADALYVIACGELNVLSGAGIQPDSVLSSPAFPVYRLPWAADTAESVHVSKASSAFHCCLDGRLLFPSCQLTFPLELLPWFVESCYCY